LSAAPDPRDGAPNEDQRAHRRGAWGQDYGQRLARAGGEASRVQRMLAPATRRTPLIETCSGNQTVGPARLFTDGLEV